MTGKLYFALVSTFFMGMFSGAYLYISVFAPNYESDVAPSEIISNNSVVIEGQVYGGCLRSGDCASFKLLENGTYNYLASPESEVEKGHLPKDMANSVFTVIGTNTFFNDTDEISQDFCDSYADGVDYTYEVTLDDESYTLDTCTTAFAYDEDFQSTFLDIWSFMEDPTKTYPVLIEEGVGGLLKDRFQSGGE